MLDQSFILPTQLQREFRNAIQQVQAIPALEAHLAHIKKKGISVATAVSIESSYPGLLLPKAPAAYSYGLTATNSEYSQEAIGEKIAGIRKNAGEMLKKLIQWLKDRCKVLGQALKTGRLKQSAAKLKILNEKSDRVDLATAAKAIGDKDVELFDNRPDVLSASELIDGKIEFDYVKSTLHSSTFGVIQIGGLLNHLKGPKARMLLTPDLLQYKIKPGIVSVLRGIVHLTRSDGNRLENLTIEMDSSIEQITDALNGVGNSPDYIDSMRALDNEQFQSDLIRMVNDIGHALSVINVNNIENTGGLDADAFEQRVKVIRNTVTMLGEVLHAIHMTMKDMVTLSGFGSLVLGLSSKELLTSYIRSGHF